MEEGYIKFRANWMKTTAIDDPRIPDLLHCRKELFKLGLVGAYPNGVGFGNVSCRGKGATFFITGSATGAITGLDNRHIAQVTEVHPEKNYLECCGPVIASSESMSHGVIYQELPWVNGVIHVHHLEMWGRLLGVVPTTDASAPYGSPEMAGSIKELIKTSDLPSKQIFVMEGHREGVFTFGKDLRDAMRILRQYLQ